MSSHKKLSAGLLAVFLSAVAVPGALADASKYIVTDLGTNPGTSSTSPAIQLTCLNNYGQIAGTETTSPYISQGLLWTPYIANSTRGTFTGLGTFGGAATGATGINDAGKVTGWCQVQDPNYTGSSYVYWAFIWSPFQANGTSGQGSPILPPPFLIAPNPAEGETWGGIYAVGASPAINNADQIADQAWFHYLVTDPNDPPYDDAIYEPGIWNGNWSDLNGTPYWSYNNGSPIYPRAYDSVISANSKSINNNGDVVGVWDGSPADFGVAHICVWKSDGSFIDIHRGGTFNNNYGEGVINDEGLVTGVASAAYPGDHNGGIVWDSLHLHGVGVWS